MVGRDYPLFIGRGASDAVIRARAAGRTDRRCQHRLGVVSTQEYVWRVNRRPRHRKDAIFQGWTLLNNLGVGGNGEAWRVSDEHGNVRVMKLLRPGQERYDRFKREVTAVNDLVPKGFPALPIEHAHLPENPTRTDPAFYVMPEAVPIGRALRDKDIRTKVAAVEQLLPLSRGRRVSTGRVDRHVKPANLYEYEGRFVLGDFGLVTEPTLRLAPSPPTERLSGRGRSCLPRCWLYHRGWRSTGKKSTSTV